MGTSKSSNRNKKHQDLEVYQGKCNREVATFSSLNNKVFSLSIVITTVTIIMMAVKNQYHLYSVSKCLVQVLV